MTVSRERSADHRRSSRTRPCRNPARYGTHRLVVDQVPPLARVLDVGCAGGYLGRALGSRGCRVWGVDSDPAAVAAAGESYAKVRTCFLDSDLILEPAIIAEAISVYGLNSASYLTRVGNKGRRHLLRTALINHPGVLLTQPHLAAGLAVLKTVEAAGFLSGILART